MTHQAGLNQTVPLDARLQSRLEGAAKVHIAVAYASRSGVETLMNAGLPSAHTRAIFGLGFARTDPAAVEALHHAGADVRLFLGRPGQTAEAFHPKLYLIELGRRLVVFSGSSNLTSGGLSLNVEQYEELVVRDRVRDIHLRRFRRLWQYGEAFDDVAASPDWARYRRRYRALADERARTDAKARRMTDKVASWVRATREWHELRAREGLSAARVGSLRGKRVAVSGRLPDMIRIKFERQLTSAGAAVTETVKRDYTDLLIVGKGAGSKLRLARSERVPRMSYFEARKLVPPEPRRRR